MRLLVDIGNTRVKWATCAEGGLSPQRAAEYATWSTSDWQHALFAGQHIESALVATVAGNDSRLALEAAARNAGVAYLEFVNSTAEAVGLRNAYPNPRLLGVDRWLALIGGYHLARGACCVVDIGTAATLDTVDASGQHLGGFIVPGPRMMARSLQTGTSDLASRSAASAGGRGGLFADNTRDAIERGCRLAVAALVDRAVAEMTSRLGSTPVLLLTGGGAAGIEGLIETPARHVRDLVLRGLAVVAAESGHD